jgi:dihydroorotase
MYVKLRGGTLVRPEGSIEADVVCRDGVIEEIGSEIRTKVDEEIDVSGQLVFPGFIDPHVHSRDPGLREKETFAHMTASAAAGGVTTVFDMPNVVPPLSTVEILEERIPYHEADAHVDFGLWGIAFGQDNLDELPKLIDRGVIGIKLFWGYAFSRTTGRMLYTAVDEAGNDLIRPPDNGGVLEIFETVSRAGGLLAAHCEDKAVLDWARAADSDPDSYEAFLNTRPDVAEAGAVALGIEFARYTGCRFHVVHVSAARSAQVIRQAKAGGAQVTAETCPQYLTLTNEAYRPGATMKVYPPIRRAADQAGLWDAIRDGTIDSIGSDHAPHTLEEKARPLRDQPAGAAVLETTARVLLNEASLGRITYESLAWLLAEGTARIYGVYPQKGRIEQGADADFTIVDPERPWRISNAELHSLNPLSPWDGASGTGAPTRTILRGRVLMVDGELTSGPGYGQFVGTTHASQRMALASTPAPEVSASSGRVGR